jgi:hypothetical protein
MEGVIMNYYKTRLTQYLIGVLALAFMYLFAEFEIVVLASLGIIIGEQNYLGIINKDK